MPNRVLLLGYFGQDNLGDDIHTGFAVDFIRDRFGPDSRVHVLNQGRGTSGRWGGFPTESIRAMHPESQSFSIGEVWFDSIKDVGYDFVLTCNSGFPNGFSFDVVARAIDRGIPVAHLCVKEQNVGGIVGRMANEIFEASEFTNFRFRAHRMSYDISNPMAISGVDLAFLVEVPEVERSGRTIVAPRWSGVASYDVKQVEFVRNLISTRDDIEVCVLCSSYQDISFIEHLKDLPIHWTFSPHLEKGPITSALELIASSDAVISLGRLHAMILAMRCGVKTVYVECDPDTANSPMRSMRKIDLLGSEFGVPMIDGTNDADPLSRAVIVDHGAFSSRCNTTITTIGYGGR